MKANIQIEDEEKSFFIDGADESNSNWLRYVNSARCKPNLRIKPRIFALY